MAAVGAGGGEWLQNAQKCRRLTLSPWLTYLGSWVNPCVPGVRWPIEYTPVVNGFSHRNAPLCTRITCLGGSYWNWAPNLPLLPTGMEYMDLRPKSLCVGSGVGGMLRRQHLALRIRDSLEWRPGCLLYLPWPQSSLVHGFCTRTSILLNKSWMRVWFRGVLSKTRGGFAPFAAFAVVCAHARGGADYSCSSSPASSANVL